MYIACPGCNTKFVVTPEQIGKDGRKVKCSKCSHIWYKKLDEDVRIEPALTAPVVSTTLGNGVNLPALLPMKIPPYLYMMPVVMIGLIIFMLVMLFPDNLGFESLLNSDNLSIKDVQIVKQQDIEKITVSYKVHNTSLKDVKMPLVRVRLCDNNNKVLKSLTDYHTNIISPNQFLQVKTEFMPVPSSADNIDIMMGNEVDFILR